MKISLKKRWCRAALAGLLLTVSAGAGYINNTSAGTNDVIPASFFGLHDLAYPANGVPVPPQPWGLFRTWDHWGNGNISWAGLEPSRGTFNWSGMDATLNALPNGVAVIHCFGHTPLWAASSSTAAPTNILDWDLFITNFVTRYHTRVKYLEVWNEAMVGEGFYTGTTAQLVQLAQHLYTITKSIDPTVTVLTPDATGGKGNMTTFYNGYFAAGGGAYADAIAFHGYGSMVGTSTLTYPEEIIGIVGNLKAAMNSYGQASKPIFDTEGSWGTTNNAPTVDDRVAFLARHYLLQWSLGVSIYAWYAWDNTQWGQLWSSSGGLNPAGIAYQQLYHWMVGATMNQPVNSHGSVYTCGFTRPGGYQALAVWNTNRTSTSNFTVPSGYTQYRDLAGHVYTITGPTVTIGIKPILLEKFSLGSPAANGSQFIFNYSTISGQTNQLQYSTDLTSGVWLPFGNPVVSTGAPVWVTNNLGDSTQMFVRLCLTP